MKRLSLLLAALLLLGLAPAALAQDAPVFGRTVNLTADGPALTFAVYPDGQSVPEHPDEPAYRVTITREDGTALPELRFACLGETELADYLRFRDLNFDGYLDVEALYVIGATNSSCTYFLYDVQAGAYTPCDALSELSNYELYPKQKLIYNSIHDSAATGVWQLYQIEGGQPRLIRQVAALYDEETNYEDVRVVATQYFSDGMVNEFLNEPVTEAQLNDPATYNAWGALLWDGFDSEEIAMRRIFYVNTEGGQHYHSREHCPTISEKFWPSVHALDDAALNEEPYSQLTPCSYCCGPDAQPE